MQDWKAAVFLPPITVSGITDAASVMIGHCLNALKAIVLSPVRNTAVRDTGAWWEWNDNDNGKEEEEEVEP